LKDDEPSVVWARNCDDSCSSVLAEQWATKLHLQMKRLCSLVRKCDVDDVPMFKLRNRVALFEHCSFCLPGLYPECDAADDCDDGVKLLRRLQSHFATLRTLMRTIYKLRQEQFWLWQLDSAMQSGNWDKLLELDVEESQDVGCLPHYIRQQIRREDDREMNNAHSEKNVYKRWHHQLDAFSKAVRTLPDALCDCCGQIKFRKDVRRHRNQLLFIVFTLAILRCAQSKSGVNCPCLLRCWT